LKKHITQRRRRASTSSSSSSTSEADDSSPSSAYEDDALQMSTHSGYVPDGSGYKSKRKGKKHAKTKKKKKNYDKFKKRVSYFIEGEGDQQEEERLVGFTPLPKRHIDRDRDDDSDASSEPPPSPPAEKGVSLPRLPGIISLHSTPPPAPGSLA
jgi:hypothetical protein